MERCEICWQGGNLSTEKDPSGFGDQPGEYLSRLRVEENPRGKRRDVLAVTRVMGQMDVDGSSRRRGRG